MIVVGCSHGQHLAKKVAKKLNVRYMRLQVKKFPDNELYIRFPSDIKGQKVILVQSFYDNLNEAVIEVIFAVATAKEIGAKEVILVAPYFPYLRQDKRFNPGECVSNEVIAHIISNWCDEIFIIDPHLHREKTLSHIFKIPAHKLTANNLIADYIKKNIKNPLLLGPDEESFRWAKKTAEQIGADSIILEKKRFSGRKVKVFFNKKIDKSKNIVLVDDIISTGNTLIETIKQLKKMGIKKITCIAVHGIFAEDALRRIQKTGAKVIAANTIPNNVAKIDVSGIISKVLK